LTDSRVSFATACVDVRHADVVGSVRICDATLTVRGAVCTLRTSAVLGYPALWFRRVRCVDGGRIRVAEARSRQVRIPSPRPRRVRRVIDHPAPAFWCVGVLEPSGTSLATTRSVTSLRSAVDPAPLGTLHCLGSATGEEAERAGPRGDN